jgi:transcriptional regulator with XRE-family HTH domain
MKTTITLVTRSVLRDLRKQSNLKQIECQRRTGISASMLSRIEIGGVTLSLIDISKLCEVYGTTLTKLFTEVDNRVKHLSSIGIETVNSISSKEEEESIDYLLSTVVDVKTLNKVMKVDRHNAITA